MSSTLRFRLPFDQDLEKYLRKKHPEIQDYRLISKSLDARGAPRGVRPTFDYVVEVVGPGESFPQTNEHFPSLAQCGVRPIIIGAGPAGLFCALRLAEFGISGVLLERGESANKRMLSIAKFWRYGQLDPETNVCYGEGGAGLFSDGKLITRVKSPYIPYVMSKFVQFGAPEETAYVSNPHLGSNKIRGIITKISDYLKSRGWEIHYKARVDELLTSGQRVTGVKLADGREFFSEQVVLATGHSSKETYQHLLEKQVAMKPKDFAIGVRVEHKRTTIDRLQHGKFCESEELGSARYRLSHHDKLSDRGSYSFCMCPGGHVLSSGTEVDGLVVNGMSNFARHSPWSNSALVVSVKAGVDFKTEHLLGGLQFQHGVEKAAYQWSKKWASGREIPAMTLGEFVSGKTQDSVKLPHTSCPSGLIKSNLHEILPEFVGQHLREALYKFDRQLQGFLDEDALLLAPETRTSSPLTILRDAEDLTSTTHQGLYPAGEGAGHAGGITSAAVDGVKVAMSIVGKFLP